MKFTTVSFGNYIAIDSIIHRLDGRAKLLLTILLMATVFSLNNILQHLIVLAFSLFITQLAKVLKLCLNRLKIISVLLIVMTFLSATLTPGTPILSNNAMQFLTVEGFVVGFLMGLRLVLMIILSSLLTLTTTAATLTQALENLLKIFKIVIPVSTVAMIILLILRFIPTFIDEGQKILKAQASRGYQQDAQGVIKKAGGMVAIVIPLLSAAFRRTTQLADAMDSRGFVASKPRTSLRIMKFSKADFVAMIVVGLIVMLMMIWR